MSVKRELVIYLDIGLIGTFVSFETSSDKKYFYLKYVPLDSNFKNVVTYEKPILRSAIHHIIPPLQMKGVPDRIIYIFTDEAGSLATGVMKQNYMKEIEELQKKVESLEAKNTALSQEVEDARAGVSKSLSNIRNLSKKSSVSESSDRRNIFDRFRNVDNDDNNFEFD